MLVWTGLCLEGVNCKKWICPGYGGMEKALSFLVMLKAFRIWVGGSKMQDSIPNFAHHTLLPHTPAFSSHSPLFPLPLFLTCFNLFLFSFSPLTPGPCLRGPFGFSGGLWGRRLLHPTGMGPEHVDTWQQRRECAEDWQDHVRKPTHPGCSG